MVRLLLRVILKRYFIIDFGSKSNIQKRVPRVQMNGLSEVRGGVVGGSLAFLRLIPPDDYR
jgi:hypothetical protein